jgi:hypothetical protein
MARVPLKAEDAPNMGMGVGVTIALSKIRDEEKQHKDDSKNVGTVYHSSHAGLVMDGANPDGYHYPVNFPSMWEWAAAEFGQTGDGWGLRDLVPSGATEFLGSFLFFLMLNTAISASRSPGGPYLPSFLLAYGVILTAGFGYIFVHSSMWFHSVNIVPALSLMEFIAPHSWKKYGNNVGMRWGPAAAMLFVQWAAQFLGTLLGTYIASLFENTLVPGSTLDFYQQAGLPIVTGVTATQAGGVLAMAFYVYCLAYFCQSLENYRNASAQTRSLYVGLTMSLVFFFSFQKTGAVFSVWQPISSQIVAGAGWLNYNSDSSIQLFPTCDAAAAAAGASCFSNMAYWSIYTWPCFVAALVAWLTWLFVLRLTSAFTGYSQLPSMSIQSKGMKAL